MLAVTLCFLGILAILLINEYLWRQKALKGELKRKFVHIVAAVFIAFWPWLVSWRTIQFIGLAMVVVLLLNRQFKFLHYLGNVRKDSYGDVFLAVAVTVCALITDNNLFFAIAILHVALADGFAAIIGTQFGKKWRYEVFGQTKTLLGSMTFWIVSIWILGIGLLSAHDVIPFATYAKLILLLPPALMVIENVAIRGLDNLLLPIVIVAILEAAQAPF